MQITRSAETEIDVDKVGRKRSVSIRAALAIDSGLEPNFQHRTLRLGEIDRLPSLGSSRVSASA